MAKGAPTTALKPPSASASVSGVAGDEEEDWPEADEPSGMMPLAVVVLVLAVLLLIVEVYTKMSGT